MLPSPHDAWRPSTNLISELASASTPSAEGERQWEYITQDSDVNKSGSTWNAQIAQMLRKWIFPSNKPAQIFTMGVVPPLGSVMPIFKKILKNGKGGPFGKSVKFSKGSPPYHFSTPMAKICAGLFEGKIHLRDLRDFHILWLSRKSRKWQFQWFSKGSPLTIF